MTNNSYLLNKYGKISEVNMNGVMNYNWLGIAFISDDLPSEVHIAVEKKMDKLEESVNEEFDRWLSEKGLERVMGVIMQQKN